MLSLDEFKNLDRVISLKRRHATGTPRKLAEKLDVSERQLMRYLSKLKEDGLPIRYSSELLRYYFTEEVKLSVSIIVGDRQLLSIIGGNAENAFSPLTENGIGDAQFCRGETADGSKAFVLANTRMAHCNRKRRPF